MNDRDARLPVAYQLGRAEARSYVNTVRTFGYAVGGGSVGHEALPALPGTTLGIAKARTDALKETLGENAEDAYMDGWFEQMYRELGPEDRELTPEQALLNAVPFGGEVFVKPVNQRAAVYVREATGFRHEAVADGARHTVDRLIGRFPGATFTAAPAPVEG